MTRLLGEIQLTAHEIVRCRDVPFERFINCLRQTRQISTSYFTQIAFDNKSIEVDILNEEDVWQRHALHTRTNGELLYAIAKLLPSEEFFNASDHIFWEGLFQNKDGSFQVYFGS
jgi:hypothetical protein